MGDDTSSTTTGGPTSGAPQLSGDWSIGEAAFAAIVRDLTPLAPTTIVEFGSGPSSVRLAQAFARATILSIEADNVFAASTRELAAAHGVGAERLTVVVRPLRFRVIGAAIYETHAEGAFPADIDAVLVDGPPHWTERGREACLHDVFAQVRVGGRIYLDDYRRDAEQLIGRHWMQSYPNLLAARTLDVGHGIGVYEKRGNSRAVPRIGLGVALDTWAVHLRRRLHQLASRLRSPRAER